MMHLKFESDLLLIIIYYNNHTTYENVCEFNFFLILHSNYKFIISIIERLIYYFKS